MHRRFPGLIDRAFLAAHTTGLDEVRSNLEPLELQACAARTGIDLELIRRVARRMANARSCCIRADLGLQQSLHSTLNSYLEKLLFLMRQLRQTRRQQPPHLLDAAARSLGSCEGLAHEGDRRRRDR